MRGFIFNNKHNMNDFNVPLLKKSIQSPSKKKIKDSVPYMNGSYDFSTVATNGEAVYTEREILVQLGLPTTTTEELYVLYSQILEWLMDLGKSKLVFDDIPDFYFLAEIENAPSFEEVLEFGKLEVVFLCDPFKVGINYEGDDVWDTFNFEVDIMQDVEFDIMGSKTITLQNVGRIIVPTINCDSGMTVTNNGYTANFVSGNNRDWKFKLQPGVNTITISGTGHIKFIFRKEML